MTSDKFPCETVTTFKLFSWIWIIIVSFILQSCNVCMVRIHFFFHPTGKKNWLGKKIQQLVTKSCICVIMLLAVVLQLGANQGSRVTVTIRPYVNAGRLLFYTKCSNVWYFPLPGESLKKRRGFLSDTPLGFFFQWPHDKNVSTIINIRAEHTYVSSKEMKI